MKTPRHWDRAIESEAKSYQATVKLALEGKSYEEIVCYFKSLKRNKKKILQRTSPYVDPARLLCNWIERQESSEDTLKPGATGNAVAGLWRLAR